MFFLGFQASYYSVGPGIDSCRGGVRRTLSGPYGTVVDGHGSGMTLPSNASCSWVISPWASGGSLIVTQLDLPASYGWLKVYDGVNASARLLGQFTGYQPQILGNSMRASGMSLYLEYTTSPYSANPLGRRVQSCVLWRSLCRPSDALRSTRLV